MSKKESKTQEQPEQMHKSRDFTDGERTFRYDFNRLSVEQGEYAIEALEFKREQLKKGASTFNEITRSGGAHWLSTIAGFLLVPVINGVAQRFDEGKMHEAVEFVKNLPMKEYDSLKECLTDFFIATGKQSALSALLQNRNGLNASEVLSQLVIANLNASDSKTSA